MVMLKHDCFARPQRNTHGYCRCQAIKSIYLTGCQGCGFYRSQTENDCILLRLHNTLDLDEIVRRYAEGRRHG